MMPIRLSDAELRELMQAAQTVPYDLRRTFLERVAAALRDKDLGDGLVHRIAHQIASEIIWNAGRRAVD